MCVDMYRNDSIGTVSFMHDFDTVLQKLNQKRANDDDMIKSTYFRKATEAKKNKKLTAM